MSKSNMPQNMPRPGKGGGPMMGGGPAVGAGTEKAEDFKGTIKKLFSYLGIYKIAMIVVFVFAIGGTIFSIWGPKILGNATTEVFNGIVSKLSGGSGIDFGKIGRILIFLLCIYLLSLILNFVQGFIMSGIAQKLCYRLRKQISKKIDLIPMEYYDGRSHGEVLSIVTNDIDILGQNLNQSLIQMVTSITMLGGIVVMMLTISWLMTLVAFIILPVSFGLVSLIIRHSQKYFQAQQDNLGEINGQVEEIYGGQNVVKAFNNQEGVQNNFEEVNDKLYHSAWKSQAFSGTMMPIMNFVGNLGYAATAILGGVLAINNVITVGNIQSFIQYIRQFTSPIQQLAQIANMLQSTAAAAERVFNFLEWKEEDQTVENAVSPEEIEGSVQFAHVQFGYSPDKIIIHDFSSIVEPGQKIAIVGPTGAGKTTMVKLLMRFYDVNEGAILVDGYDIKQFARDDLRSLFGMVLQDTWLFGGTIMENIRYGKLDATDEEVIEAAKAAHVHSFVKALPDGYQMEINEEANNISQGQKQLLTIARAILANPKILILDEATSSVDTRTEILIQKAMDNLMKGRTSFVIAHRLSTIRDADKILVMRDGDIVEQGNHDELMKKNGFYAKLYNAQFEKTQSA